MRTLTEPGSYASCPPPQFTYLIQHQDEVDGIDEGIGQDYKDHQPSRKIKNLLEP